MKNVIEVKRNVLDTNALLGADLSAKLTALGKADAVTAKAINAFKAYCVANEIHPNFFLSPRDKQGKVDPKTKSTATPAQYDAQLLSIARGMGKASEELFLTDPAALNEQIAELTKLVKGTKVTKAKKELTKQIETLKHIKASRSELLRKLSSGMRDKSRAVFTAYAADAKARALKAGKTTEEANKAAQETREALEKECGMSVNRKPTSAPKVSDGDWKKPSEALLAALQETETPPLLSNKEFNQLIALLNKVTSL